MIDQEKIKKINLLLDQENYDEIIVALENCIEENQEELFFYWYLGLTYLLNENEQLAYEIWFSIFLQGSLEESEQWAAQLVDFLENKVKENIAKRKLGNAIVVYENIAVIQPEYKNIELLNNLVENLALLASDHSFNQEYNDAVNIYLEVLNLNPNHTNSWHALALCYYYLEKFPEAEYAIRRAIKLDNYFDQNYHVLGLILQKTQNNVLALEAHNEAIKRNRRFIDAYISMGDIHFKQENIDTALNFYQVALSIAFGSLIPPILKKIANIHEKLGNNQLVVFNLGYSAYLSYQNKEAIPYFEEFLITSTDELDVYLALGKCYILNDQPQAAISLVEKALKLFPNHPALVRLDQSILPIIYSDIEEVSFYRQRFTQKLEKLANVMKSNILFDDVSQQKFKTIETTSNYFLGFQGKNDLALQKEYATFLHSSLKQIYPDWCQPISIKDDIRQRKIRIGFVSSRLHGLGRLYFGWLKYLDKNKFQTYVYDISGYDANVKLEKLEFRDNFKENSDYFQFLPSCIDDICPNILADNLDILIFPEITVELISINLSCLRLAPIQCTSWAHPITSGSPTIDYFLSSYLMEPSNGEEHYSEILVRLPNLGFAFERLPLRTFDKKRSDFGLRNDATVYLCCQNMPKYLPQYDYIFPSIAQGNPSAQFVFFDGFLGSAITEKFKKRLNGAFNRFGLKLVDFCTFSPTLSFNDYLIVQQLSDVFLDTFGWSGGVTSHDAIACGLPIVTCPGELMRGRQSYGMLKRIGVTETIAETETEYIEIAVRLGLDHEWRQSIHDKMAENKHRLFDDQECVRGLESFLEEAVQKYFKMKKNSGDL
ncbi:hypothetical protein IQE94_01500 [Synechocystis sp. PCC 7339]|uniref:tetratricopeptide repeat protein n=1 Tax=Synechocystis sp. PCC 7339 TaxID=2782213 RepID=UPI001CBC6BA6|nr:CDC27 family protein [Synechocystis sp. PCC 7339]UAJ73054.1 hypothetical protein IQE94_01500 [Synechocystis sp. PCC 7339]